MATTRDMSYIEQGGHQYVRVADVVGLLLDLHDKALRTQPQIGSVLENIAVEIATPFMALSRADGS